MKLTGSNIVRKKSRLVPFLIIAFFISLTVVSAVVITVRTVHRHLSNTPSVVALIEKWKTYD